MAGRRKRTLLNVQVYSFLDPFPLCLASLAIACTCLGVLLLQHSHVQGLRDELWELKLQVGTSRTAKDGDAITHCQDGARMRRELTGKRARKQRQLVHRQLFFLHLVPVSSHSYDDEDVTRLKWTVGQSQGEGLQVSGETITVTTGGHYFIYSQVLYEDSTFVMGHVIKKHLRDNETSLMKCMKSMPGNVSLALNTCYTAGAHYLEAGSVLELSVPRKKAGLVLLPHTTFLGIYKI